MVEVLNDILMSTASSPWIYAVLFIVCIADGFFPPVPSETLIVAAVAVGASTGQPMLWGVLAVAAAGAITGDSLCYLLGRRVGITRFKWMRRPSAERLFTWAAHGLATRPASLILVGRYIPVGRIAVNVMAGATGLPFRRFLPLTILAGICWAAYSTIIGTVAAATFHNSPLLAAVVAVIVALALGVVVDRVSHLITSRRGLRPRV
ncbi:DedA family protein [Glaciihabitans sp. dw_435]|uniref:DedA family protein n=1 Tax=Glaciihabitans sp. dw_435 TaxID=2720081 RepID=UPI001BD348E1|nr:DedA family protein [Glaciihabitans sp. dw_435]